MKFITVSNYITRAHNGVVNTQLYNSRVKFRKEKHQVRVFLKRKNISETFQFARY